MSLNVACCYWLLEAVELTETYRVIVSDLREGKETSFAFDEKTGRLEKVGETSKCIGEIPVAKSTSTSRKPSLTRPILKQIKFQVKKYFINDLSGKKILRISILKEGSLESSDLHVFHSFEEYQRIFGPTKEPKNKENFDLFLEELLSRNYLYYLKDVSNELCRKIEAFYCAMSIECFISNNSSINGLNKNKMIELGFAEQLMGKKIPIEKNKKRIICLVRPEMRPLVQHIKKFEFNSFLDIGAGRGALGLIIACLFPKKEITCLDQSEEELKICSENAMRLGLKNVNTVQMRVQEIKEDFISRFDLVSGSAIRQNLVDKVVALGKKKKKNMVFYENFLEKTRDYRIMTLKKGKINFLKL